MIKIQRKFKSLSNSSPQIVWIGGDLLGILSGLHRRGMIIIHRALLLQRKCRKHDSQGGHFKIKKEHSLWRNTQQLRSRNSQLTSHLIRQLKHEWNIVNRLLVLAYKIYDPPPPPPGLVYSAKQAERGGGGEGSCSINSSCSSSSSTRLVWWVCVAIQNTHQLTVTGAAPLPACLHNKPSNFKWFPSK